MAGNGIGVSLQVDGEKKFKTAMQNAANAVKNVDSRLKLATEEFKKNGDAQKLMQTRSKTLNEEIKRQTQIVNSLDDALKTTEKQYGENSQQALHYEAQLNRARQKLIQMQSALENNAQGLDENGRAFDEVAEKAEEAALSFSDVNQAITNLQSIAKSAATHVINFAKSAWSAMSNASEYADSLLTLSAQTGLSVEQLQRYARAAGLVDTEVSAIYTAMARMVNPSGEMADALQQLGVNTREIIGAQGYTGKMSQYTVETQVADTKARNALDVFWDTIEALKALNEQGKDVDELTKSIFGKSFLEMKPLIEAGKKGWDEAGESLHNVISDESIENLGKFNDQLGALQSEFNGLKYEILGQLAPSFTDIAKALTGMLVQFGEWAKSEAGQEALGNLSDAISNIVKNIGEDDFESLINTATSIIEGLAGAINSITNDPSGIIDAVKGALIGYAALSVSKEVLSLLALLRSLGGSGISANISKALGNLSNLFMQNASAEGATPTSNGSGAPNQVQIPGKNPANPQTQTKDPWYKRLWSSVPYEAKAVAGLLATGFATNLALDTAAVNRDYGEFNSMMESGEIQEAAENAAGNIYSAALGALVEAWNDEDAIGSEAIKAVFNNPEYQAALKEAMPDDQSLEELLMYQDAGYIYDWDKIAADVMKKLTELSETAAEETVTDFSTQITEQMQEQEMSWFDVFGNAGSAAGESLAAGLMSSLPSISGAVSRINAVVAQISAGPATTTAYGMGKVGASSYTRNNNIYINNLNQSNAADIYDTLRSMNSAQETMNRGYGYVPVLT